MAVALQTGIPHTVWLDDPEALVTAVELLAEQHKKMEQARTRRRR